MGRVRQRGTALELTLRKALWAKGLRYRLKSKTHLPGSPDLIFPSAKVAVFVDGCFWHNCPIHGTQPKTRPEFWSAKFSRNRQRDADVDAKLTALKWKVVRVWEHEITESLDLCVARIQMCVQTGSD